MMIWWPWHWWRVMNCNTPNAHVDLTYPQRLNGTFFNCMVWWFIYTQVLTFALSNRLFTFSQPPSWLSWSQLDTHQVPPGTNMGPTSCDQWSGSPVRLWLLVQWLDQLKRQCVHKRGLSDPISKRGCQVGGQVQHRWHTEVKCQVYYRSTWDGNTEDGGWHQVWTVTVTPSPFMSSLLPASALLLQVSYTAV